MKTVFLVILSIIGVCSQSVFKKAFSVRRDAPFVFSVISVTSTALAFLIGAGKDFVFSWDYIPYSLGFGIAYAVSFLSFMYAIKEGSLALTSLSLSYSLVIPTLYGIIFLGEKPTALLIIGIILLLVSLYLTNYEKSDKKITLKWGIYTLLTAIGNGVCSIMIKLEQINLNFRYRNEFMVMGLVIVVAVSAVFALFKDRKSFVVCLKPIIFLPIACGLANALGNFCSLYLSHLPTSFVSPICSAGGILGTSAISLFIYKEKFKKKQIVGIALGTLAVITISLKDIRIENYIANRF